jgi:hypothetical protein
MQRPDVQAGTIERRASMSAIVVCTGARVAPRSDRRNKVTEAV